MIPDCDKITGEASAAIAIAAGVPYRASMQSRLDGDKWIITATLETTQRCAVVRDGGGFKVFVAPPEPS